MDATDVVVGKMNRLWQCHVMVPTYMLVFAWLEMVLLRRMWVDHLWR